jgi:site-specific recombinase XerD
MGHEIALGEAHSWPIPTHLGVLANPDPVGWQASSDVEALAIWLAEHGSGSEHTASSYKREIERFLLWLADQGMTVSDAMREDYHRYAKFLLKPKPASKWVSKKRHKRSHAQWKPFNGPLSPSTARQSLQILYSAISYLKETGWLKTNPMPSPKRLVSVIEVDRKQQVEHRQIPEYLFDDLEKFVLNTLPFSDSQRDRYKRARYDVAVALAGLIGARSADMTEGFLSDFSVKQSNGKTTWLWHIPEGKGRKSASLPVPDKVMSKISHLRLTLGMTREPEPGEKPCPILANAGSVPLNQYPDVDRLKGLNRSSFYRLMRELFTKFAVWLRAQGRRNDARLMEQASTHWLRHTAVKRITSSTNNLVMAQKLARHANINTTAIYAKSTIEELYDWYQTQGW